MKRTSSLSNFSLTIAGRRGGTRPALHFTIKPEYSELAMSSSMPTLPKSRRKWLGFMAAEIVAWNKNPSNAHVTRHAHREAVRACGVSCASRHVEHASTKHQPLLWYGCFGSPCGCNLSFQHVQIHRRPENMYRPHLTIVWEKRPVNAGGRFLGICTRQAHALLLDEGLHATSPPPSKLTGTCAREACCARCGAR